MSYGYRRSKYGAKRTKIDGVTFDSKAEARHYLELKALEKAGKIEKLVCHPAYRIEFNGTFICRVELDFTFFEKVDSRAHCRTDSGYLEVFEDVKGVDTAVSRLKRKLLKAFYGIEVRVIPAEKIRKAGLR